jgi:hypothetical protein
MERAQRQDVGRSSERITPIAGASARRSSTADGLRRRLLTRSALPLTLFLSLAVRALTIGPLADQAGVPSIDTFLARCADPAWWTQTIAFTAASGRVG